MKTDQRLEQLTAWLLQFDGLKDARPEPASEDASFRRYFRVRGEQSYIVMDAPPPQEDCDRFVTIAGFLEQMGLNAPRIVASDIDRGFLLLTDLGSIPYLKKVESDPESAPQLYSDAMDALSVMQAKGTRFQRKLPPYDDELLRFELSLFQDWFCDTHLGVKFSASDEQSWKSCCDVLVHNALQQQQVFVHRDYHSRNLMVTDSENPGIIDFQDAVEGPMTYDLVSLLKDCYVKWPADVIRDRAMYFYRHRPRRRSHDPDPARFMRHFDLMGVQRHLKAVGIFARLLHRDGKTGYTKDIPRTLSYIADIGPQYEELKFLVELLSGRVLPALEESG